MLYEEYIKQDGSLGCDAGETAMPQNFGITTKQDV